MKTVRKAVLAASVAAALTPAVSQADTTLFGYIDIAVGIENANESTLAVEDSPAADSIIGIEGEQELENGHAVTYQYIATVTPANGANNAFGAVYHAYLGYKTDLAEVRVGTLDLPLRLALDKADLFAGTYADQNNIIGQGDIGVATAGTAGNVGNSTASNTVMLLGGNETLSYALSASATDEVSNNPDTGDDIIAGGLVDLTLTENLSFAAGFQHVKDTYSAFGISANIGLGDLIELRAAANSVDFGNQRVSGSETNEYIIGAAFNLTDSITLKAQHGASETSGISGSQEPNMFAIGADFALSDSVTTYILFSQGDNGGLLSTGERDTAADGTNTDDASVTAAGIQVSF